MNMPTEAIAPSMRQTMAQTYRDLAEANRLFGFVDIAERCERNASACEFGGVLDLEPAAESEAA